MRNTLVARASELGAAAFALFALVHWLCDLVWLEALSLAGNKGATLLAGRTQKWVLGLCAAILVYFGCRFLYDAGSAAIDLAVNG